MRIARALSLLFLILLPVRSAAQSPSGEWRTLHTEHFRVHFPVQYEPWARDVASKLESIRSAVDAEVGYAPSGITDVIVADPIAQANGSAWPFLGAPRMIFWASPPSPAGALGHESDWGELLAIHEWGHVAHLARPSRNPLERARWILSPVALGPIATAPRWVSEGYATVLEGKLTGQGRPFSDYRAVILRTWAQRGRLPSYEQLDSDSANWMGMSMAYLVGSSYLEWLVEREGGQSLTKLWARMTARESRTFDQAFQGVYGDSPKHLYQRFTAELTHRAMLVESAESSSRREGEIWMDLSWTTGEPDLNADGTRLVTIIRGRQKPSRIVTYSTGRDEKAEGDYQKRIDRMLERDPEDFAPVRKRPLPRKPETEHVFRPGEIVGSPRWIGSTGDILFVRFVPDRDGYLHPDLHRWSPASAAPPSRLTFGADLRDARPSADGSLALAVRNRFGLSELVRVDLQNGSVSTIAGPALHEQFVEPAPHPLLSKLALVERRGGKWHLVVRDMEGGGISAAIPFDGIVAQPSWSRDGTALFATVARDGFIEIARFDYDSMTGALAERGVVTRGTGASLSPVASNDALWFLALDPDGLDLRRLPLRATEETLPPLALPAGTAPAVRRSFEGTPPAIALQDPGEAATYGTGRQEVSPLMGGGIAPSGSVVEAGVRVGDVLGRMETLALFSAGFDGGAQGGSLSMTTRRFPVSIGARFFAVEQTLSEQKDGELSVAHDNERLGLEAWLAKGWRWSGGQLHGRGSVYASDIDEQGSDAISQLGGGVMARIEHAPVVAGGMLMPMALELSGSAGSTDDEGWSRVMGGLSMGLSSSGRGISIAVDAGSIGSGAPWPEQFEIGGVRSSILPDAATSNRVDVPALPAGVLRGNSFDSETIALRPGGGLPGLFAQRVSADVESGDDSISIAGLEWTFDVDAMPVARIPALEFRAGVARVLDEGLLDGDTSAWVTMRWKP
ncbi:MAG: hypothetical protein WC538_11885 [Thermoanaerobaculia bacterium]|jgi:hypothetical protein